MAGPLMNVVISIIAIGLMHVGNLTGVESLNRACFNLAELSMYLFFFNLLPIPPLDGSYVLKHITGMTWEMFHALGRFGFIALILVIQIPQVQMYLAVATVRSIGLMAKVLGVV
jgi:Zn-dependent protease